MGVDDVYIPETLSDEEFVQFAHKINKQLFDMAMQRGLDDIVPILRKAEKACKVLVEIRQRRNSSRKVDDNG